MGLTALIPSITTLIGGILDRVCPDPKIAADIKMKLLDIQGQQMMQAMINDNDQFKAAANIVLAEANSSSWLTKNWRPLTMLMFVILIAAHWFGYNATNLTAAEYSDIYELMKLGLGGYVVGRSAEKMAPAIVSAIVNGSSKS